MSKNVKMSDIAKVVGVSTVSVSKALSGQKGVSEEIREKIKAVAEEMGYVSPAQNQEIQQRKTYNIGILIAEKYLDNIQSFYWNLYHEIATKAVSKNCFTMLEVLTPENEKQFNIPRLIEENKVDGIMIIGLPEKEYLKKLSLSMKIPYICVDFYDEAFEFDSVVTDNYFGMYKMVNYLFSQGHEKIAYVGKLMSTNSITDRYFGYCKALLEHGQPVRPGYVIDDRDDSDGYNIWLKGDQIRLPEDMPTAFACNCDVAAAELILALNQKGYRVPEDISVVGFDNYLVQPNCSVGITTYEVDVKEMARKAINTLIKKMSGEYYKKGLSIVEGRLVIKDSVSRPALQ